MNLEASLADRYAYLKALVDAQSKDLEKLREQIKQTGKETLIGDHCIIQVRLSERSSLDRNKLINYLSADILDSCEKKTVVTSVNIKPKI
jgi:hypothetical protein